MIIQYQNIIFYVKRQVGGRIRIRFFSKSDPDPGFSRRSDPDPGKTFTDPKPLGETQGKLTTGRPKPWYRRSQMLGRCVICYKNDFFKENPDQDKVDPDADLDLTVKKNWMRIRNTKNIPDLDQFKTLYN